MVMISFKSRCKDAKSVSPEKDKSYKVSILFNRKSSKCADKCGVYQSNNKPDVPDLGISAGGSVNPIWIQLTWKTLP